MNIGIPDRPDMCRVWGSLIDLSGKPLSYREVSFRPFKLSTDALFSASGAVASHVSVATDSDGFFSVDVFRGAGLLVTSPAWRGSLPFTAPDAYTAKLSDLTHPYPVGVHWCVQVGDGDKIDIDIETDEVNVLIGDEVSVWLVWDLSNRYREIIPVPPMSVNGVPVVETDGGELHVDTDEVATLVLTSEFGQTNSIGETIDDYTSDLYRITGVVPPLNPPRELRIIVS